MVNEYQTEMRKLRREVRSSRNSLVNVVTLLGSAVLMIIAPVTAWFLMPAIALWVVGSVVASVVRR